MTTNYKRVVIKVGTSTLTHETGKTNIRRMQKLCAVLSDLHNAGQHARTILHRV